jgi:hypothetical protein
MRRTTAALLTLIAAGMLVMPAVAGEPDDFGSPPVPKGGKAAQGPPPEGIDLAESAPIVPITNGPATPKRKVLSQTPPQRPCWATAVGEKPLCPIDRPGHVVILGTSSGAATRDGAILNAYQNAVEKLAARSFELGADRGNDARERARALAYRDSGILDGSFRYRDAAWTQEWEERFHDSMRVYHRAFVLLVLTEDEARRLVPAAH